MVFLGLKVSHKLLQIITIFSNYFQQIIEISKNIIFNSTTTIMGCASLETHHQKFYLNLKNPLHLKLFINIIWDPANILWCTPE